MGFFSKLFGESDEAPPQEQPAADERQADAREANAQPASANASTKQASSAANTNASSSAKQAQAPQEREAPRVALRSPPPPPPPPPLGASAAHAAVAPAPPPAAVVAPPPPPAGVTIATSQEVGRPPISTPNPPARGGRSRAVVKPAAAPPKPAAAPAVKVGGAAAARQRNHTVRGMPAVAPPPIASAAEPARATEAISDPGAFEQEARNAEVSDDAVTLELNVTSLTADMIKPALQQRAAELRAADTLDTAVDDAVDRLLEPGSVRPTPKDAATLAAERAADQRAAAATFRELLAAGTGQLRELVFQLSVGRTPRHWAASCRPVIASYLTGAREIELGELAAALELLDDALARAASEVEPYVSAQTCGEIEQAYAQLAAQLPDSFAVPADGDSRRMLLLESLLLQVPAMYRRTLNKLYGAGLGSLEQLSGASAEEIAAVAGIDRGVADAITVRVRSFEQERNRWNPAELRAAVHEQLRGALGKLGQLQQQFERAELEEAAERKRAARRAREAAAFELDLLLSELGELSLIEDLKRCAVHAKIRRLEGYLERAQAAQ